MARSSDSSAFPTDKQAAVTGRDGDLKALCASVCTLAAAIFDLPIVFLRLTDGPVAAVGIDSGRLDHFAFVERVLDGPLIVADATRDSRYFLETTVLRAPHIRFYADMPLVHDGRVLGVIGLAEPSPRHDFDVRKLALLEAFAGHAAKLLYLAGRARQQTDLIAELQARQARLDSDMTGLGYWKIDLNTRDVIWSSGFYAILGLTPETYTPTVAALLDIFEPEDRSMLIERLQASVNDGQDFDVQLNVLNRKDHIARRIRMRGGVESDTSGVPVRLCAVVRDLSVTATPLRDVSTAKDEFLAHVTDELRRPLNDIVGYARLLDTKAQLNPDIATYTHDLLQSAETLQKTLGRQGLTAAPIVPEASVGSAADDEIIDVTDLIREVVNAFTEQAARNHTRLGVHFSDFTHTTARMDVMRVQQVLQNLISNACKFTQGGVITVTARQVTTQNPNSQMPETHLPEDHLHVSVRDTGVGMSDEQSAGLFSGRTRGLGLSITKTIVEMLGGQIGVTSRPGDGTTAWFEIPVAWTAPLPLARDPKATPIPSTLARESFGVPSEPRPAAEARRPAYAPIRPSPEAVLPKAHPPVDADRINREYLRALLADMKLDL
ncbi:GAF domain-containing sensor histidine kinase [Asticcacaulis sp. 201]|uniref:GAF domain-containing sensor histidine kinase n=1 Tax=Asticcacaulis sp. 201 TaxID=3028787 RepID=UPI0029161374|nr:ATP-binding protein [Asticcacaulis sp. 201]MDV6332203.1 ATP-binding protein [Asticcacaulis sp. 201]